MTMVSQCVCVGWGRERETDREQETEVHAVQVCVDLPRFVTRAFAHMCACFSVFGIMQACACTLFISVCFVSTRTFVP